VKDYRKAGMTICTAGEFLAGHTRLSRLSGWYWRSGRSFFELELSEMPGGAAASQHPKRRKMMIV